jgi:hypothetical protein
MTRSISFLLYFIKSYTFSMSDVLKSSGHQICFKLSTGFSSSCGGGCGGCSSSCCCTSSIQAALAICLKRPEEEVRGDGTVVARGEIDSGLQKKLINIESLKLNTY